MRLYTFTTRTSAGHFKAYSIKAASRSEAIREGFRTANITPDGETFFYDCRLKRSI